MKVKALRSAPAAALAVVFALSALDRRRRSRGSEDGQRLRRSRLHDLSEAGRQEG